MSSNDKIIIKKDSIIESFINRKNINKACYDVGIIMLLNFNTFKVIDNSEAKKSENKIAVYDENSDKFAFAIAEDLINDVIFPAICTKNDAQKIVKYFDTVGIMSIKEWNVGRKNTEWTCNLAKKIKSRLEKNKKLKKVYIFPIMSVEVGK